MTTHAEKVETLKSEESIGWTVLVEWFGGLEMRYITAEQLRIWSGLELKPLLKTGWLAPVMGEPDRFVPCAELKREIESLKTAEDQGSTESRPTSEAIHVSTIPFPHVVPTPTETVPARETGSEASNNSNGAAGAVAALSLNGRWDANPVCSPLVKDIADMIGSLKECGDCIREELLAITESQAAQGWPERERVLNGVVHLRRLSSDLFNQLAEYEFKSQFIGNGRES